MNNCAVVTYLDMLTGKVFKLLPMREDYDCGVDNHLSEYVDNLKCNLTGALALYPELSTNKIMAEVCGNISSLTEQLDSSFYKWRSMILRTVRLIRRVILSYTEV